MAHNLFTAYVGLGSNLGNPEESIRVAITALGSLPATEVTKKSSLYRSAPIDADGGDYVNAVVALHTHLAPAELLMELQNVERQFGRIRSYQNAPRTLDCDLLLYEQQIINTPDLQTPHPRMHQRAFVLIPLFEIAPELAIPNIGTVKTLLNNANNQRIHKLPK